MNFFKIIYWYFLFSKWLFNLSRLECLVQFFECIMRGAHGRMHYSMDPILEFCRVARIIINNGEHTSRYLLEQLKELLQEISNMGRTNRNEFPMYRFLTNGEPICGSSLSRWSSAQLYHFMMQVLLWKGDTTRLYRVEFDESIVQRNMNADDQRRWGTKCGPVFRQQINLVWMRNGLLLNSFNEAKIAVSTPRTSSEERLISIVDTPRSYLNTSRSSVDKPMTPRTIHASNLSLTSIPPQSPRSTIQSPRSNCGADGYLTRAPKTFRNESGDRFFLLTSLLSDNFSFFLRDAYDLSRLNREGNLWFLHDRLAWFKGTYGNSILFNAILQDTFFDALYRSMIVKGAFRIFLADSPDEYSFDILRQRPLSKQEEFFEILKMVIMHELWLIQNQSELTTKVFMYKCPKGAWKQDPETFDFVLVPQTMAEMVKTA